MQELDIFPHLFIAIDVGEPLLHHQGIFRNGADGASVRPNARSLPHGVAFSIRGLHHRAVSESSPHNADQVQFSQRKLLERRKALIVFASLGIFEHHGKWISSS